MVTTECGIVRIEEVAEGDMLLSGNPEIVVDSLDPRAARLPSECPQPGARGSSSGSQGDLSLWHGMTCYLASGWAETAGTRM